MIIEGIYRGKVWHQRFTPIKHRFNYEQLMVALDLDKLSSFCRSGSRISYNTRGIFSLRDRDHFPHSPKNLRDNIVDLIPASLANQPYRIIMLSQLAHFGFSFNPISFFFIISTQTEEMLGLILEVHNTPWGERHYYPLFDLQTADKTIQARFEKALHVSPFLMMNYLYAFSLSKKSDRTFITMDNWHNDEKHFSAGISLQHFPLTPQNIKAQFYRHAFSPHKTVAAIYWQALILWLKGVPFCPHPKSKKS